MTQAGLGDTAIACVKDKENADPTMASVIDAKGNPSLPDAQKYVPVLLTCISKADFAKIIVSSASGVFTADQQSCITSYMASLSDSDFIELAAGTNDAQAKLAAACPSLTTNGTDNVQTSPSNASFKCSDNFVTDTGKSDPTSISGVQLGVCNANPTASWAAPVLGHASWAVKDGLDGFDITVMTDQYSGAFGAPDALAACIAIDAYLSANGKTDWPLTVGTGTGTVTKPTTVLANKPTSGTCTTS